MPVDLEGMKGRAVTDVGRGKGGIGGEGEVLDVLCTVQQEGTWDEIQTQNLAIVWKRNIKRKVLRKRKRVKEKEKRRRRRGGYH